MKLLEPTVRRWTRREYYAAAEQGWFEGQRVQLIKGEVIQMPPMGEPHVLTVAKTRMALEKAFGSQHWVRHEAPLSLPNNSEPEPDVAVAELPLGSYTDHPTTALLVVEVSDATLRLDRRLAGLYASAGIPEYWIVNLRDLRLEVHRQPTADTADEFGYTYSQSSSLSLTDHISPVAKPEASIAVRDLFP